jgi:hypothetical protein
MEQQWNEIDRGKPTTQRKTCPSATLSTTNLTWTDPGSNPDLGGERPVINHLSHGTAIPAVLAVCISVPPAAIRCLYPPPSHPGSTLLAVITPTDCYPAALSIIYVIDWLSFLLGLLTREDGTDTLYRNVGKQLPHDAT